MADIKTIDDENFAGKKVLVRVDFNAPVDADGNVTDDTRIRAALPTINKLVGDGARVILTSHRGRPAGEGFEESFSLGPIARRLQELLGRDIVLSRELIGPAAQEAVDALEDGDVLLLENIRFDKREKKNDPEFARCLGRPRPMPTRTTPSARLIAPMPPRPVLRLICPPMPAISWSARWPRSRHARRAAPPLRRHSRRLEGLRQDQGHRRAAGEGRHPHHRRRHVLHVPGRPRANPWVPRSWRPIGSSAPAT